MPQYQLYLYFFFVTIPITRSFLVVSDWKFPLIVRSSSSFQFLQLYHPHHGKSSLQATHPTTSVSSQENQDENVHDQILHAIGVPETLQHLNVGQCLKAFRHSVHYNNDISSPILSSSNFTIERVSEKPNIFLLRDFLSHYECDFIMNYAMNNATMTNAETITQNDTNSRKRCQVAWLPSSTSSATSTAASKSHTQSLSSLISIISNLVSTTANILLSKDVLRHPSASVEDLQVLKYDIGGEFVLHHDGEPRILTVIYYVNGVGGTWFPLASTASYDPCRNINEAKFEQNFLDARKNCDTISINSHEIKNKAEALKLGKGFIPGKQGLLFKGDTKATSQGDGKHVPKEEADDPNVLWIKKGDAIAFYNYKNDGSGQFDWRSLHTGLPTSQEDGLKWIANHWFRLGHLNNK